MLLFLLRKPWCSEKKSRRVQEGDFQQQIMSDLQHLLTITTYQYLFLAGNFFSITTLQSTCLYGPQDPKTCINSYLFLKKKKKNPQCFVIHFLIFILSRGGLNPQAVHSSSHQCFLVAWKNCWTQALMLRLATVPVTGQPLGLTWWSSWDTYK